MSAAPDRKSEPGVWVTNQQVRLCGNANTARFLAQCLYWSKTDIVERRQGWFYKTRTEWQSETWLSRYQQEKARQTLKGMGLLQERHERRQTGIRLWFRLDRAAYYRQLNGLADQSEQKQEREEDVMGVMDVNCLTEQSENNNNSVVYNEINEDESKSVKENSTIVPIYTHKSFYTPENGTIVSENIAINEAVNSDSFCSEIETPSKHTDSSSESLTVQPDNQQPVQHTTDLAAYQGCHPFIYQYLNTLILSGPAAHDWVIDEYRRVGFGDARVLKGLYDFVKQWGHSIQSYYQDDLKLTCPPLSQDDIDDAILVSRWGAFTPDKRP